MKIKRVRKEICGKNWLRWGEEFTNLGEVIDPIMKQTRYTKCWKGWFDGLGFVYATDLVFMDVLEEEKEENLKCHSETLALAFGVLKSVPGTYIGVSKNLHTCHDCLS